MVLSISYAITTVNKNVIISDNYRLLKLSTLDNAPVSENIISEIKKK